MGPQEGQRWPSLATPDRETVSVMTMRQLQPTRSCSARAITNLQSRVTFPQGC